MLDRQPPRFTSSPFVFFSKEERRGIDVFEQSKEKVMESM